MLNDDVIFFQRTFPSANMVLLRGPRPILVDSGFGSDAAATSQLLRDAGIAPESLQLVVNTHYHCDHVGGNHHLQQTYGIPIAAHAGDATLVNRRDREACSVHWLNQRVEPYTVNRLLQAGDVLDTGSVQAEVLHVPGHTLNHIALYAEGILICGDTVHAHDVAWLNMFREGVGAIDRMMATLDMLSKLPLYVSYSGHGVPAEDPQQAIDSARRRYEKWLVQPEKIAWHACKRLFTYALMIEDGLTRDEIEPYLLKQAPWYADYCLHMFGVEPQAFVQPFLDELLRSKAADWHTDGRLLPSAPYRAPARGWMQAVPMPEDWP